MTAEGMTAEQKNDSRQLLERTREIFKEDLFATEAAGVTIEEAKPGYARCEMELKRHHRNAMGAVMGGAIFTLADLAGAVAMNCGKVQPDTVSLHGDVTFLGEAKGQRLIAKASCVKAGRTTSLFDIDIADELGTKVARASINGFTVKKDK